MSDNQDEESKSERSRSRSRDRNEDLEDNHQERDERRNNSRDERNNDTQQQSGGDGDQVTNLYVRNLSTETTEEVLRAAFTVYGEVTNASIVREPITLVSRGFGFVAFRHLENAEAALEAMINGGAQVDGRTVKIEKARRSTGYEKTPGRYLGPPGMSMKHGTQQPPPHARGGGDDYHRGSFPPRNSGPGGAGFRRGDSRDRDYRGGGDRFLPPPYGHHHPAASSRYPPRSLDPRDDYRNFPPAAAAYDYRDDPRGYDSRNSDPRAYPQPMYRGAAGITPMLPGQYRDDPRDNYLHRGGYAGSGGSGYRGVPPMAAGGAGGYRDERMYDRDYIRPLPHVGSGHPADHLSYAAAAYDQPRGSERGGGGAGHEARDRSERGSRDRDSRDRGSDRDYPPSRTAAVSSAAHAVPYDRHAAAEISAPVARSTDRPPYRGSSSSGAERY